MAVVETLEIEFRAQTRQLSARLGELTKRFSQLGTALPHALEQLRASTGALVRDTARSMEAGMGDAPEHVGRAMLHALADGMAGGAAAARSAARAAVGSISFADARARTSAQAAGAMLCAGLAKGIASGHSEVVAAAGRIANAAAARLRQVLQIHSPSRVTLEMGAYFSEGFASGIRSAVYSARQSAEALGTSAAHSLRVSAVPRVKTSTHGGSGIDTDALASAILSGIRASGLGVVNLDGKRLAQSINRETLRTGKPAIQF